MVTVNSFSQLMFSKFEYDGKLNPTFVEGPFELPLSSVRAYMQEPIKPRSVILGAREEYAHKMNGLS